MERTGIEPVTSDLQIPGFEPRLGQVPLSHRVGVTAGLARGLVVAVEVEPDAEDERGEGGVPSA
jgi:hypothetical protein